MPCFVLWSCKNKRRKETKESEEKKNTKWNQSRLSFLFTLIAKLLTYLFNLLTHPPTPLHTLSLSLHRAHNNWQTSFASINKSNDNSPQTSKKQRDCGETARDSLAYSCLLKNELLGSAIDDVKTAGEERNENSYTPAAKRSLFKYQSPTNQVSSPLLSFTLSTLYCSLDDFGNCPYKCIYICI